MTHHREPLERHMLAGITEAMREKLAERRHHGDWREETPTRLLIWLREEVSELQAAVVDHEHETRFGIDAEARGLALDAVRSECADVALLAGMILDVVDPKPLREGDTEAARWAERNRVLEARLAAVREAAR